MGVILTSASSGLSMTLSVDDTRVRSAKKDSSGSLRTGGSMLTGTSILVVVGVNVRRLLTEV